MRARGRGGKKKNGREKKRIWSKKSQGLDKLTNLIEKGEGGPIKAGITKGPTF